VKQSGAQWRKRKRRQRERRQSGVYAIVRLRIYEDAIDAAIQRGEITEEEADDRSRLEAFVEDDLNHRLLKGEPLA
jgi:hypothetical protein